MSLSELCSNIISNKQDDVNLLDKDIIEFCTAPWGLGLGCAPEIPPLYPAQKFILKVYYGLELDKSDNRDIIIRDKWNEVEQYRFNENEYMHFLFNEGRINKLYETGQASPDMALVCGRRSGKCVSEGTFVNTGKGFVEIQELGDKTGPTYQPLKVAVAQEGSKKAISEYFYNGGEQDTIKISSWNGYSVEGTPNHRIKVMGTDGVIQWRYLGDIKIGDVLCVHRKTDMWAGDLVDTSSYKNNIGGRKLVNLPDSFDDRWATLLGVLVGDGTWGEKGYISVTVGPYSDWLSQVCQMFRDTVGDPKILEDSRREVYRVSYNSTAVRSFFDKIGYTLGVKSDEKRVPWVIWKSPKPVVASFLRGFFETDGCAEADGRIVSFSTASKKLAYDIQLLLLNFGIVCRVKHRLNKKYNKTYYNVTLLGAESCRLFFDNIGFLSERKQSKLQSYINNGGYSQNKSATESIPYQKEWCRNLLSTVPGMLKRGTKDHNVLRMALGNVIKNSEENLSYPRIKVAIGVAKSVGANYGFIKHFEDIIESGYFFDEIVTVSNGRNRVYDLNVPEGESFVANGITNHNTTITSSIISYEAYKLLNKYSPQEYYGIMPEQDIRITCISTSKDAASELFNMVTGHIERSEFFRKYRNKATAQWLYLRTQRDIDKYGAKGRSSVSIRVAPCSARGLRGANNIVVALDEMAFFFSDEKNKDSESNKDKNDRAIYKAVTPSVARFKKPDGSPDGKVICISSPGPKTGKFFEEYERSFEESSSLFMMQAPTWEIYNEVSSQFLKNKFRENPIAFKSEYGAQFSDRLFGWIDDPVLVRQNVVPGLRMKERSSLRVPHFMGIDVGLKNDGSAVTIGHWVTELVNGVKVDRLEVDYSTVKYAINEGKDYFVPDEIAEWIAVFADRFFIGKALMDQYYGMTIVPLLHKKGLKQFEYRQFTDQLNSSVYQVLLTDFISSALRLPEGEASVIEGLKVNDSELVKELLTLQAEQKSKYMIKVSAPERKGEHDDMSDSLARMVFIAHEFKNKSYSSSINPASTGMIRAAKMIRRSEMVKASLNRPSPRMMGMTSNRMRMPLMGGRFR
jgi:intein/homing endonuclease